MKNIILLFLFLIPVFLFAQYPTQGNKSRLGYQTTGDGLIWRGVAADTAIKPRTTANAYFQLDTVNRVLRRYIATQGSWQVVGGTPDLSAYLEIADTAAMLSNYTTFGDISTALGDYLPLQGGTLTGTGGAGFLGLIAQSGTPSTPASGFKMYANGAHNLAILDRNGWITTFDISAIANRDFTYPSVGGTFALGTGTADRSARWSATNTLAAGNFTDNGTKVQALLPFQLHQWTTAGRPSGVTGYKGLNTTTGFEEGYFTSQWENYITSTGAANGQVSIFSSAGKIYGTNNLFWDNSGNKLKIGNTSGSGTLHVANSAESTSLLTIVAANQNPYLARLYNNAFSTTTPVFEYFAFNTGEFRQGTINGDLTFTTNGYSNRRMIIKNNTGYVGIGSLSGPSRLLHVEGEVRIADLTTDTPTRIVGADADGDLGALALSGLTISSGTLTATPNWLKTQMEAGNNVNINAGSTFLKVKQGTNNFWKIKNGDQFYQNASDGLSIIPWNDTMTTRPTGSLVIGGYHLSGKASNFSTIVTQYGTAHSTNNTNLSYFNSLFGYDSHSDSTTWNSLFGAKNLSSRTSRVTIIGSGDTINASFSGAFGFSHTINQSYRFQYGSGVDQFVRHFFYGKLMVGTDSTFYFNPDTDLLRLSAYGTPATTAAALSKTLTNYGVGFATDGTVTSREIKRDTTIYVTDADYDFSAAITTAQIASRFNRVIFWMTTTGAAGSDSDLTLHTPDANLLQVEYLIHSVDEPAGFDNKIVFGTNNAVDSTNGLVTNYYPAAGDGIHIRAGLRSGVYKYRYSN